MLVSFVLFNKTPTLKGVKMFNWVKRLFKKDKVETYEIVMYYTGAIQGGRSKGGKFSKGNTIWSKTKRGKDGRFTK